MISIEDNQKVHRQITYVLKNTYFWRSTITIFFGKTLNDLMHKDRKCIRFHLFLSHFDVRMLVNETKHKNILKLCSRYGPSTDRLKCFFRAIQVSAAMKKLMSSCVVRQCLQIVSQLCRHSDFIRNEFSVKKFEFF